MFKMPTINLSTCSKAFLHKSLFEMVNVAYVGLINTFLKDAAYLVIDQIEIRAIGGSKNGRNKIWSFS